MPRGLLVAIILAVASIVATSGAVVYVLTLPGGPFSGGNPFATVTVTGHVFAGANAAVPVDHAAVYMQSGSGVLEVFTDASGVYVFNATPGTSYIAWATLGTHWGSATSSPASKTMPTTSSVVTLDFLVPASDVTGVVKSATTGLPISGAMMSIADPSADWWCCQYTGSDGRYLLWAITPGSFNVSAAAPGYGTMYATVSVPFMYTTELQDFPLA